MDEIISHLKKKCVDYEIYSVYSNETSNEIFNDRVSFTASGNAMSLGIRVAIDKKIGFSYTDNLKDYKRCIDAALYSAKNNEPDKDFPGFGTSGVKGKIKPSKEVLGIDSEWISKTSKEIITDTKSRNKNIMVSEGGISKSLAKVRIVTSEGLDAEESYGKITASFGFSLKKDSIIENVGITKASEHKLDTTFGKEAAERLESLFVRKSIDSGNYQLLLHPETLAALLSESYAFSINAENVHMNKSRFCNMNNKPVFHKSISITDDGTTKWLLASRSFDSEGTKTRITKVIDNGILKSYISDRKYGQISKKGSTGNASRSASTLPSISTNNVIMRPGTKNDLFSECGKAIYARGLLGVHTMNEATGDFSLGVQEGHLIKNGKVVCPLKGVVIGGNFFKIMNDVTAMSKKLENVPHSGCSYLVPYALFNSITATSG